MSETTDHNSAWGRRALLFTILGVFIVTLFPFEFLPRDTAYRRAQSVLHWLITSAPTRLDVLNNVVFFIPLGFSLACWWQKAGWRRLVMAWVAGAGLSLLVEYLQVFLPTRAAQWADVITNSTGAAVGFLIFQRVGPGLVRQAVRLEWKIERFFTLRRIVLAFCVYAALMTFCSVVLQQSTSLTHWSPSDSLFVGTDGEQRKPWPGRVLQVQMADKAVPPRDFREVATADERQVAATTPLLLDLAAPGTGALGGVRGEFPAKALVEDLSRTRQFTLRLVCIPEPVAARSVGSLVLLSKGHGQADFILGEYGGRWLAGIRSKLWGRTKRWDIEFAIPPQPRKAQEITVSYDGSRLSAFMNGKPAGAPLWLNPGAKLAGMFKGVGEHNIYGYGIVYDGLVFAPLGFLLALAARKPAQRKFWIWTALLLMPVLMEAALWMAGAQSFRLGEAILGQCLAAGGLLLLNSDSREPA